ncbi:hypothetical protein ACPXCP_17705 [Streptomyces sp. DT20]|uniref:hypothetical protein n=1 Tax=unclassified Streptomyces TaxID=2593676 RepID=UPI003CF320FF
MFDNGDDASAAPARRSKGAGPADSAAWPVGESDSALRVAPAVAGAVTAADEPLAMARREFAVLLGEFRRTAVLVPLDEAGDLWSAEQGGVRWICAFS